MHTSRNNTTKIIIDTDHSVQRRRAHSKRPPNSSSEEKVQHALAFNDKRIKACISRCDNGAHAVSDGSTEPLPWVFKQMELWLTADSSSSDEDETYEASPATMNEGVVRIASDGCSTDWRLLRGSVGRFGKDENDSIRWNCLLFVNFCLNPFASRLRQQWLC